MASLDFLTTVKNSGIARSWRSFGRLVRHWLPTGLYTRSLIIIILPMILLQGVVAAVFMERHWQLVTERLSAAVTRDISAIIELLQTDPEEDDYQRVIRIARDKLDLSVYIEPKSDLPAPRPEPLFSILDRILADQLTQQIGKPFWIDTYGNGSLVEIRIQLEDKTLRVFTRRSQAYASNTHIFLVWMVGASLVLIAISILFLRGQIKPIESLALAAESFGKGQKISAYSPRGADEVRRAGLAFILMRERIERQMEQRTAMLNGVSHDLRTILTRFKLQLALAGDNPDLEGLDNDVEDMQSMLEAYLTFAQTDVEENVGTLALVPLLEKTKHDFALHGKTLSYELYNVENVVARPNALSRLVANLAANAQRYANRLHIDIRKAPRSIIMTFDDDGPGIPEQSREDVFKPFFRLDEARNLNASGTGLGLSIVRDIARSHGGEVTLGDSAMGGLRVIVKIPA
ncbi:MULTISPECIES: ATP-binding protein [Rhizobium/Agrobacterium group]|uniref:ATP-binding protein n=1 Tax=Rhizobium/Agrobacterium group TaxID=227290 RepID=UPI00110E9D92|nr:MULTISPECIES: ATP-binding protein [Rhizobium/Agrobacterium group]NWJ26764.1 HAMP domain-containing protein [Rhizobium sp. RM]TMV22641.1 HAMP domain-containing protein [Rhizobium sp. Td3]UXS02113.1 HAMP domain-containing protein [Agrobacterium tumefaciens]